MKAIDYKNGVLYLLDQTLLPEQKNYITCENYRQAASAIQEMKVRGAPAIGVTAAFGIVLAAREYKGEKRNELAEYLQKAASVLGKTRPTAVNLFWALRRMETIWENNKDLPVPKIRLLLEKEAIAIAEDDVARNKEIGRLGRELVPTGANILTHCNAGALATAGYGTALGVIRAAHEQKKDIHVFADETRPLLQGARLTAWELQEDNIPVTVITDSTAGYLMQQGKIDLIIVGADRIAANGDTANKIGTYSVAVLAKMHRIPFYVAAPFSTVDLNIISGKDIPIEERQHDEIRRWGNNQLAPHRVNVYNPAFDVTPANLISAIITDYGIARAPYDKRLVKLAKYGEGRDIKCPKS